MGGKHEGHEHHGHSGSGAELSDDLVLSVEGMTCNNCATKVSKAISSVSNVVGVEISLGNKEAHISGFSESGMNPDDFAKAVTTAGYPAKVKAAHQSSNLWSKWSTMVAVGASLTAVMMTGDWFLGWQHHSQGRLALFLMSTIVQMYCGQAFLKGAIRQLKKGQSDMDTLVALGSWTAYLYSTWIYLTDATHHLYFAEAGSIISLVSLGHSLESKISERAQTSLKKLLSLKSDKVLLIKGQELELVAPVSLKIGDKIRLRSGDRIPVDAEVIKGTASLDEAAITGESHPIEKSPGLKLISGTLVLDGELDAKVTAVGRATVLAGIIETVRKAQNSRAAIQKLADKVSSIFVPIVVLLSGLTFSLWLWAPELMISVQTFATQFLWQPHVDPSTLSQAILCAVGVLIIACPCAMGLATPAALMAGANRAAKNGVLIRDATAIEKSAAINLVFFDKTGTLTQGKLSITNVLGIETISDSHWAILNELASKSHHPISKAIASYCKQKLKSPSNEGLQSFKEDRGRGLQAETLYGDVYRLGSLAWHQDELKLASPFYEAARSSAATINVFSHDQKVVAVFFLNDTLKPDAVNVVKILKSSGIEVGIISGDRAPVVQDIARRLGLKSENIHSEVAPEQKAAVIESHKKNGEHVAFVGDGINDAPALKTATLGIAVGNATDIAKESADLVLMRNDIKQIPWALEISGRTLKTIKENLFWAFCYNTLAIPIAFLGFVSPIICAAAMGLSDLFVILNSLRLARYESKSLAEIK